MCQKIQFLLVWGLLLCSVSSTCGIKPTYMGAIKQTVSSPLPDRLIWTNSQIAPQIESTLGCGRPSLMKIWISDQQRGQNNARATTLVTVSSWEARQMFRLCQRLCQYGCLSGISVCVTWQECYGMAVGCGSASPALHQVYIQGLMTLRNVNQRFNKQNQSHIWCTQMCTKWLQYPSGPSIFYFLFFFGCRMGGDNEKIQWIRSHDL